MDKDNICVLNEIGDMGLGCTELTEQEKEALKEQKEEK